MDPYPTPPYIFFSLQIYTDLRNDPKSGETAEIRGTAEKFNPCNSIYKELGREQYDIENPPERGYRETPWTLWKITKITETVSARKENLMYP